MKRIFTIILIGFVYAAMSYSLTPQTEHIYAFLKKMFFSFLNLQAIDSMLYLNG